MGARKKNIRFFFAFGALRTIVSGRRPQNQERLMQWLEGAATAGNRIRGCCTGWKKEGQGRKGYVGGRIRKRESGPRAIDVPHKTARSKFHALAIEEKQIRPIKKHGLDFSGSQHSDYFQHLQFPDTTKSCAKDVVPPRLQRRTCLGSSCGRTKQRVSATCGSGLDFCRCVTETTCELLHSQGGF